VAGRIFVNVKSGAIHSGVVREPQTGQNRGGFIGVFLSCRAMNTSRNTPVARLQHEPSDLDQLRGVPPPPRTGPVSGAKGIALKTGIKRIADRDPIDNDLVLIPGRHVALATLREDKDALNFLQTSRTKPSAWHRYSPVSL
jgi:hypothetical protein